MINISKKIKFRKGSDANQMIVHKLVTGFLKTGNVETTLKRAKVIRAKIDHVVSYASTHKNDNELLHLLRSKELVRQMNEVIVPALRDRKTGYVTLTKTGIRLGDAAQMAEVRWVHPIEVQKSVEKLPEEVKPAEKEVTVTESKPVVKKARKTVKKTGIK